MTTSGLSCRRLAWRDSGRKQAKVWDQISAFLFAQSNVGPFEYENWMIVLGLPAVISILWMLERRSICGRLRAGLGCASAGLPFAGICHGRRAPTPKSVPAVCLYRVSKNNRPRRSKGAGSMSVGQCQNSAVPDALTPFPRIPPRVLAGSSSRLNGAGSRQL
jgi:hypothetical protein